MREPDKQIKRKHWKDERWVKLAWQYNTRGKVCVIQIMRITTASHQTTCMRNLRGASVRIKRIGRAAFIVLKIAVFATAVHTSCWFFPSHATFHKDGMFVWGGGCCIFPAPLNCRYPSTWARTLSTNLPGQRFLLSSPYQAFMHFHTTSCYETHHAFLLQCAWWSISAHIII